MALIARAFLALLLVIAPATASAQSEYYFPVLETEIDSDVVIGVKRSGTITDVAVTTRKTIRESGGSNSVTNTDLAVRNVEETRTKATNPAKRASRPKASGLLGGVVRAFGGDYSGLGQWGAGFVDHMMEPRFVTNLSKTFHTKDNHETKTVATITSSWSDKTSFESTVTERFEADIAKGFINFSVAVRNLGARSISLAEPTFIVYFDHANGSSEIIGRSVASGNGTFNIPQGGMQVFPVSIEGLDFIDLSRKYRDADAVRVHIQDMKVRGTDGTVVPIGQVWDGISDSRVRFDYFDGTNRSVQFVEVPATGYTMREFLDQALAQTSYGLNDFADDDKAASLVRRIGAKYSDMRPFSTVPEPEKIAWRRWFATAHDRLGTPLDPSVSDKVFPGYSVQLGYYAADQVLPASAYQPIVWESDRVELKLNERLHIPVALQAGDLIEITDFKLEGYEVPHVRFDVSRKPMAECNQAGAGGFGGLSGGMSTHLLTTPGDPPNGAWDKCLLLTPVSAESKAIDPASMIIGGDGQPADFPQDLARLVWSLGGAMAASGRFIHIGDLLENVRAPTNGMARMTTNDMDEAINRLRLQYFRPGDSLDDVFNRAVKEQAAFLYAVEGNVPVEDSYWVFYRPNGPVRQQYARSNVGSVPSSIEAELVDPPGGYVHISVCEQQPGFARYRPMGGRCSFGGMPPFGGPMAPPPSPLAGMRYRANGAFLKGDIQPAGATGEGRALDMPASMGPIFSARVRVLRFNEISGTNEQ